MLHRQIAALVVAASVFAATAVPASAVDVKVLHAASGTAFRPNVALVVTFASVFSVIANAIIVASTQCRELTAAEAGTAAFLPVVGVIYNQSQAPVNKCAH